MPALENFIITTTAPASATRHRAEPAAPPPRIIVACQKAGRPAMAHRLYLFSFNATTKDERCETECSEQSNNFAEMWMPHKACNRHARRAENSGKGNSPGQAGRQASQHTARQQTNNCRPENGGFPEKFYPTEIINQFRNYVRRLRWSMRHGIIF